MQKLVEDVCENWQHILWVLAGTIIIWVAARVAVRVITKLIGFSYEKHAGNAAPAAQRRLYTASTVLKSVVKYIIWFLAIVSMAGNLGLTSAMGSMLTAAGIGGIALGIGAQSFIKDVVAGIFFVFEDQMAVGDYVSAGGVTGTVEEITLRTTVIKGFRGECNVVPNGSVGVLTNYSRAEYLAQVDIQVAYESDIARAMELIREEAEAYAQENEKVSGDPEMLGVVALNASGVDLRLVMRVQPLAQYACERELMLRIKQRFDKDGVEIPYQKVVVLGGGKRA